MTDKTDISSDSSPDRNLAQAHGMMLEGSISAEDIQDPIYRLLRTSKKEADQLESSVNIFGKEHVWKQIQSEIGTSSDLQGSDITARILPFNSGSTWFKVAAAVLLIAISSLITVTLIRDTGPELLASAGNAVEVIELSDGSIVTLRPNSSIYEVSISDNSHLYRLDGEALFSVSRIGSREFAVQAGRGEVTVLGTRFNLYERDDRTRVDLLEGSVRFKNIDSDEDVLLEPGQAAEITEMQSMIGPYTPAEDDVTAWTQNRLTFRNRALSDIVSELEFHYNIRINIPASLENEYLGGSVMLDSQSQTLRDLGTVLGGRFSQTEPGEFEFVVN